MYFVISHKSTVYALWIGRTWRQKQHIALTGQAANMMSGWPQAKIFRTDGSLAAEFTDPDLFVERKFMSILSDAAAGKTPRLLMPKKVLGIKQIN